MLNFIVLHFYLASFVIHMKTHGINKMSSKLELLGKKNYKTRNKKSESLSIQALSLTPKLYRGWRGQNSELVLWTPWSAEEQDFFVLRGLLAVEILGSFVPEGCTLAEVIRSQLLLFSTWTDHSYGCCFILQYSVGQSFMGISLWLHFLFLYWVPCQCVSAALKKLLMFIYLLSHYRLKEVIIHVVYKLRN